MRRVAHFLLLAGALVLAGAPSALAADATDSGLPAPSQLSSNVTEFANSAAVAVNASGQAVVAWVERPPYPSRSAMFVAYRNAGGAWSAPERISATGKDAASANVALDAAGTATLAWTETSDWYAQVVHVAKHPAAGYADAQTFTPPYGGATELKLDVAPSGDAVLAWTGFKSCEDDCGPRGLGTIWAATRTGGTAGTFATPEELSDAPTMYRASLSASIGSGGDVAVGWEEGAVNQFHLRLRFKRAGGAFAAAADLPVPDVATAAPSLVVGPSGVTTVTWWQARAMHAARIGVDGTYSSGQTLPGVYTDSFPQGPAVLDVDGAGRVTAAWITNDGLWTATGDAATDLGSSAMLDRYAAAEGRPPSIAVDPSGATLIAWISDHALRSAWRPAGKSAFKAPGTFRIGAHAETPRAAISGGSAVLTGWFGESRSKVSLFVTGGDPAAIAAPAKVETPVLPVLPTVVKDSTGPTLKVIKAGVINGGTKKKPRKLLRIEVRTSETAEVVAVVTRTAAGVRKGKACVAKPKRATKLKAVACTRTIRIGNRVPASLAVGKTVLVLGGAPPRGSYRVTLTGADEAGNTAVPAKRNFRVS